MVSLHVRVCTICVHWAWKPEREISWNCSYRWLWNPMQVLGIEPESSGRAISFLSPWTVSPASLIHTSCGCVSSVSHLVIISTPEFILPPLPASVLRFLHAVAQTYAFVFTRFFSPITDRHKLNLLLHPSETAWPLLLVPIALLQLRSSVPTPL